MVNIPIRLLLPAVAAFFGYGGWSLYINSDGRIMSAMNYALYYGSYSFIITLVTTRFMEWLYGNLQPHPRAATLTAAITFLLLTIGSWFANFIVGTPNILLTILPGISFSTAFALLYVAALSRLKSLRI